jgi:hypothetical protein
VSAPPRGDRLALLSFVLIVPALVTFVVGLASSGTLPLYVSLACSVVAGLALAVAARLRRQDAAASVETLAVAEDEGEEFGSLVVPATISMTSDEQVDGDAAFAPAAGGVEPEGFALDVDAPQIEIEMPPPEAKRRRKKRPPAVVLPPPSPPPAPLQRSTAVTYDEDGVLVFPIEDYDSLSAGQVAKVLRLLDSEEIETVREYEAEHEARPEVLDRIDKLLARRGLV